MTMDGDSASLSSLLSQCESLEQVESKHHKQVRRRGRQEFNLKEGKQKA